MRKLLTLIFNVSPSTLLLCGQSRYVQMVESNKPILHIGSVPILWVEPKKKRTCPFLTFANSSGFLFSYSLNECDFPSGTPFLPTCHGYLHTHWMCYNFSVYLPNLSLSHIFYIVIYYSISLKKYMPNFEKIKFIFSFQ